MTVKTITLIIPDDLILSIILSWALIFKRRILGKCHIFSVKSIQNLRTFWHTTQNLLILALLCSLYSKQTFKVHLGVEKHIERLKSYKGNMLQKC